MKNEHFEERSEINPREDTSYKGDINVIHNEVSLSSHHENAKTEDTYHEASLHNHDQSLSIQADQSKAITEKELTQTITEFKSEANSLSLICNKDYTILPFPPLQNEDIDKHRRLNEEAEKNNITKLSHDIHPSYVTRLKLERKQRPVLKPLEPKPKKPIIKRVHTKQKEHLKGDRKDDIFFDIPQQPTKPKPPEVKSVKTILGFRYSFAVEEYYCKQPHACGIFATYKKTDEDENYDESSNGWLVKTLGAKVLNTKARTLPSCNPFELRLRRQQSRRYNYRTSTQASMSSNALTKSFNSFTKLSPISSVNNSRKSEHVVLGKTMDVTNKSNARMSIIPPIPITKVTEAFSTNSELSTTEV